MDALRFANRRSRLAGGRAARKIDNSNAGTYYVSQQRSTETVCVYNSSIVRRGRDARMERFFTCRQRATAKVRLRKYDYE